VPRLLWLIWQLLPCGMGYFACGVRLWLAWLRLEPLLRRAGIGPLSLRILCGIQQHWFFDRVESTE